LKASSEFIFSYIKSKIYIKLIVGVQVKCN
jgi:hypothetical protein